MEAPSCSALRESDARKAGLSRMYPSPPTLTRFLSSGAYTNAPKIVLATNSLEGVTSASGRTSERTPSAHTFRPGFSSLSRRMVLVPAWADFQEAITPDGPAPMTATSKTSGPDSKILPACDYLGNLGLARGV